ncbi:MAG: NAD-dependent succinate-semialdehyde dehydrogenase [Balneolaceae bacterium]|nr:NAD-dependent succinate-semialdehyde dehydrogenase [Balneolaceae bacterium]
MKSINPANGELIKEYEPMSNDEIASIINDINEGQEGWSAKTFVDRAEILKQTAAILKDRKEELAELMAREMGKPLPQGISEAEKCAWVCEHYADNAADFLQDELIESDASKSYVSFQPLGAVFAIMPWNFPFWQLFRFAAPALVAGNSAVLKHSSNVTGCALEIESILHKAGVPENVFRTLIADNDQAQKVIEHEHIKAVTLTGSTRAGKAVAEKAGSELKKTVLELGGSDPYVVLKDADVQQAAETCVTSRLINSGQSCIAAKRFIVVEDVYDAFVDAVVKAMGSKKVGDPLNDDDIDIGPMAREDLRNDLHEQVQKSIEAGAECLLGCQIPAREGAYYDPSILVNVTKGMPAYSEELFGPVASIIKAGDEEEAIAIANDTDFGLGAAVFSEDIDRAQKIAAEKLEAGCCFVNAFVKSDPRLPFGGIKQSGYGRELSHLGIKEFVNIKTEYIA